MRIGGLPKKEQASKGEETEQRSGWVFQLSKNIMVNIHRTGGPEYTSDSARYSVAVINLGIHENNEAQRCRFDFTIDKSDSTVIGMSAEEQGDKLSSSSYREIRYNFMSNDDRTRLVVATHNMEPGATEIDFKKLFDISMDGIRIGNRYDIDFTEELMLKTPKSVGIFTRKEATKEIVSKDGHHA